VKVWVDTNTVEQPTDVVSGRFGSSVMFVAYDRLLRRWYWLQPKGVSEKIPEPQQIFVEKKWARAHKLKTPRAKFDKPTRIRRPKGVQQLTFEL
jgi:hypothetical protein